MPSNSSIQSQFDLQAFNTLAIPCIAQWLIHIDELDQISEALTFQREQNCSLVILGGGSNVVLPDYLTGLVLMMNIKGKSVEFESDDEVLLSVAAGENWHDLVMWCVKQGYYGLENLALIPGSVGAAPIQNIGAYGVELVDCFEYLEAIDVATQRPITLTKEECRFAYRDSIFKQSLKDKVIITRVVLRLHKHAQFCLDYPALRDYLDQHVNSHNLTAAHIAEAVIAIRQSKLPDPASIPNAGSFFKNPIVSEQQYHELRKHFPDIVAFAADQDHYKLAAGWLLERAGWKGKTIDGFAMHKQQALVLTNPQRLQGQALILFVEQVKVSIKSLFGLDLEVEPRIFV